MDVQMPDGTLVQGVPEGITKSQLLAKFEKFQAAKVTATKKPDGILSRIGEDFQARYGQVQQKKRQYEAGQVTAPEVASRAIGRAAGFGLDVIGEGVTSLARGVSSLIPDWVETEIAKGGTLLKDDPIIRTGAKVIQKGGELWGGFKESNPRIAEPIEDAANVAFLAAPVKLPKTASNPTVVGKAGNLFEKIGQNNAIKKKSSFLDDLVRPKQTASVREGQVARTQEGGFLNKKIIQPSKQEAGMSAEISRIPGIGKNKTLQGNYNIIQKKVMEEAETLKNLLVKNDVYFPRQEIKARLKKVAADLGKSPALTGDAGTAAERVLLKMNELIDDMPKSSASNLLEKRKDLDRWVKKWKGESALDPSGRDNAMSIAIREIRSATNDFIDAKAKNVPVKQSLKKQSNLYGAMENIAPKAADEADNSVKRLAQGVLRSIPLRGEIAQAIGGLATVVGAGTIASFASPTTAALGATGYGLYKLGTSPSAQKNLGRLLQLTDRAIRETKDKALLKQMRADRAVLLELVKNAQSGSDKYLAQSRKEQQFQGTGLQQSTSGNYMQNSGVSQ